MAGVTATVWPSTVKVLAFASTAPTGPTTSLTILIDDAVELVTPALTVSPEPSTSVIVPSWRSARVRALPASSWIRIAGLLMSKRTPLTMIEP